MDRMHHLYHSKTNEEDELKIPIQFNIYASVAQKTNHANQQGISFNLNLHYKASLLISEKIIKTIVRSSILRVLHDWGYIVYFIQVTPCYQAFVSFEQATQQIIEKKMQFFIPSKNDSLVAQPKSNKSEHDLLTQSSTVSSYRK